jgi:Holliday junction resolvase
VNLDIPIFVWGNLMDRDERNKILELANECNESSSDEFKINRNMVKDFFKFPSDYDYKAGQKVLCTRVNGKNMGYFVFDQIIEYEEMKYAISLKNSTRSKNPISIPKLKSKELIKLLEEIHEDGATSVSLNRLKEVV